MQRDEMRECLKLIQANYENWHPSDMGVTLNLWTESFKDDPAEEVRAAIWAIIQTSTSDFAPKVGQVREKMMSLKSNEPTDAEAWVKVYNALCNSNYHAESAFRALPPDVQRAVGGADQLRAWAVMDEQALSVAESNFKRTYRAVTERRKQLEALPASMRPQIETEPLKQIADNSLEDAIVHEHPSKADPDKVSEMLSGWRDEM